MAILIILFIVVFLPAAAVCIRLLIRREVEREISRYQQDLVQKHFEEVDNMYRQTRGWRHDLKNHLQTMTAYLELGQTDKLGQYLYDLTEDYNNEVDIVLKTGNAMLDAILSSKLSLLRKAEIRVDATASVPENLAVSDVDLSILIGNLLDNALEACLKVPPGERFVRLYIARAKDNLYIYIMNAADGSYRRGVRGYLSTKAAGEHGYGLQRIDRVIRKYRGYRERQDEGNVFATEILLPL